MRHERFPLVLLLIVAVWGLAVSAWAAELPAPIETLSKKLCPPAVLDPGSSREIREQAGKDATCMKAALEDQTIQFLGALTKQPKRITEWKTVQADFLAWTEDACKALEEAKWVDPTTRRFSTGSSVGLDLLGCQQMAILWWIFLEQRVQDGEIKKFLEVAGGQKKVGEAAKEFWKKSLAQAKASSDPASGSEGIGKPDPERWRVYLDLMGKLESSTGNLAKATCKAIPAAGKGCTPVVNSLLLSLIRPAQT
jgi:hypothetical protein